MSWSRQIANLEFEVERLRAELARRDEHIAAVRKIHWELRALHPSITYCCHCHDNYGGHLMWPCPTIAALDRGAS